jgi:uncharacterized protein YbcI
MTTDEQREDALDLENSTIMRDVSRAIVRIYKEQFGRGPETVSTHLSGGDTIVTILKNSLTPVELSMREMGEVQRLRDIRLMFQHATEAKFRAVVEQATGRRVVGFMSGIDVEHDLSCEVFTLEPAKAFAAGPTQQE